MKRKNEINANNSIKKIYYSLYNTIRANPNQKTNPLIKYINSPIDYDESIICDFEPDNDIGILYLSLKYYQLYPHYIESRSKCLYKYTHKFLLVVTDILEPEFFITNLNIFCFNSNITLILSVSNKDAASYLMDCRVFLKLIYI